MEKVDKNIGRITPNHTHISRPYRTSMHSLKMMGGKLYDELRPEGIILILIGPEKQCQKSGKS